MRHAKKIVLAISLMLVGVLFWISHKNSHYRAPRTSFGDPDLQGLWTNVSRTELERKKVNGPLSVSPQIANKVVEKYIEKIKGLEFFEMKIPEEFQEIEIPGMKKYGKNHDGMLGYDTPWWDFDAPLGIVNNHYRTSWIVEPSSGRVPYTPESLRIMKIGRLEQTLKDGPEQRRPGERCLIGFGSSGGPPMLNVEYNNNYQIVQSPGYVVIVVEMVHDARIIRLGGHPLPENIKPWMGDSIGHWEKDTLVVETTNRHPEQAFTFENNHLLYISPGAKLVERFTRVAEEQILYEFQVEDPAAYKSVWRAEIPMRKTKGPMFEFACHEGNRSMEYTLSAARYREKQRNLGNKSKR